MHGEGTGEREHAERVKGLGQRADGPITFIVRVSSDEEGDMTAVMERDHLGLAGRRSRAA